MDEYIDNAVNTALGKFWESIATSFPDVIDGDVSPGDAYEFDIDAKKQVEIWLLNTKT